MVKYFNEGGGFMWPVLIILIFGLAIIIYKFISLMMQSSNTRKLLKNVNEAILSGNRDQASEVCAKTRGPVASIINAGLIQHDRGLDQVEKAMTTEAEIEMASLEKGLTWIGTATSLAPMFGFMGTVWGMITAFDEIAKANDISPTIVAGGIKVALLTTVFGLLVAVITQFFHNYFQTHIDNMILEMQEAARDVVNTLIEVENR